MTDVKLFLGTALGAAPHLAKSTQSPVLSLPSESEFPRAVDVFRSFQVYFLCFVTHIE